MHVCARGDAAPQSHAVGRGTRDLRNAEPASVRRRHPGTAGRGGGRSPIEQRDDAGGQKSQPVPVRSPTPNSEEIKKYCRRRWPGYNEGLKGYRDSAGVDRELSICKTLIPTPDESRLQ